MRSSCARWLRLLTPSVCDTSAVLTAVTRTPSPSASFTTSVKIVLALRVLVGQPPQPARKAGRGQRHDARIHFAQSTLLGGRVGFFHDALDRFLGGPDDAAIARGIVEFRGQHCHSSFRRRDERPQRVGLYQRHVAVQDERHRRVRERGERLPSAWPVPSCGSWRTKARSRPVMASRTCFPPWP